MPRFPISLLLLHLAAGAALAGELTLLPGPGVIPDDRFGSSVAISGDTLVVGARDDDDAALNAGAVFIYARNRKGPLPPPAPAAIPYRRQPRYTVPLPAEPGPIDFSACPKDLQLVPRDLLSNLGSVRFAGSETSGAWSSVVLRVSRDGIFQPPEHVQVLEHGSCGAPFSFSVDIPAELHAYDFELSLRTAGATQVVKTVSGVVAGDVYLVQGQSNAAAAIANGSANGNQGPFIRSFGSNASTPTGTLADPHWHLAEGDFAWNVGPGGVGQWGLRLGRRLVDTLGVPVALLNGAQGSQPVAFFQRNDANPLDLNSNYGRMLWRCTVAGVTGRVRAILWYQGESDPDAATHLSGFSALYEDWKQDFTGVERIYVHQLRQGCGVGPTQFAKREVQRRLADTFPDISVMSTTGIDGHDGCHFDYADGYARIGDNLHRLLLRDLYGQPLLNVDAPNIKRAYFDSNARDSLTLVMRNQDDGLIYEPGAGAFFEIHDSFATVVGGSVSNHLVQLQLSEPAPEATALSWTGHPGAGPWVTNTEGVGLLAIDRIPIEAEDQEAAPWRLVKKIDNPFPPGEQDAFGSVVAIDGDTLAVGAPHEGVAGSVALFGRDVGGPDHWGLLARLTSTSGLDNEFGSALALDGDRCIVGSPRETVAGILRSGAAYVYERPLGGADQWGLRQKLLPSSPAVNSFFGSAVDISGDTAVVGHPLSDANGESSGQAFVFQKDQDGLDTWGQVRTLSPAAPDDDDQFGHAVSISGDRLAVSAPLRDPGGNPNAGTVFLFERNHGGAGNWGSLREIHGDASGDAFGLGLALERDDLVVGAPRDAEFENGGGAFRLFRRNHPAPEQWGEVAKRSATAPSPGERFGYALALSEGTVLAGSEFGESVQVHELPDRLYRVGYPFPDTLYAGLRTVDVPPWINGEAPTGFTVDPPLPAGLMLDGQDGRISGTPVQAAPMSTYTVTALHPGGDHGTAVSFQVLCGEMSYALPPILDLGEALPPLRPAFKGASTPTNFQVNPPLPPGLMLDPLSGELSGTASASTTGITYAVTADAGCGIIETRFSLQVQCLSGTLSYTMPSTLMHEKTIKPAGPAYDGLGALSRFTIDPPLPNGLCLDPVSGRIRGTPFGNASHTVYTISAEDRCGTVQAQLAFEVTGFFEVPPFPEVHETAVINRPAGLLFGDRFGFAVAVSEDLLVAGAHLDNADGVNSGSAYIFSRDLGGTNSWGQVKKIVALDAGPQDRFGFDVDIEGDTVVIGSPMEDKLGFNTGAAYIYQQDVGGANNWGRVAEVLPSIFALSQEAGYQVAISSDLVLMAGRRSTGSSYICARDAGGPNLWGEIRALAVTQGVDLDGDTLVGTEIRQRDEGGSNQWGEAQAFAGAAVSGDYLAEAVAPSSVRIRERHLGGDGNWGEAALLMAPNNVPGFGSSLAIDGSILVIGAEDDNAAFVYVRTGSGAWVIDRKLVPSAALPGEQYGHRVSLSGTTVALGSGAGDRIYLFDLPAGPPPPQDQPVAVDALRLEPDLFRLQFIGEPGFSYTLQYTPSLTLPDWRDLGVLQSNAQGLLQGEHRNFDGQGYYRLRFP